ncbi:VOC family protein [Streptomyces sp. NBC_01387]|uniref:VOC family protein n=1 Tax=unclassified Streptomyces TaxID=2593676 RepID=UPI002024A292|nr:MULTISPECIES: VOC family protein [unclassified Streptomyces]WSC22130.1 VOC family protein [Streptomyces sp. NBC_01766]
MTVAKLRSVVLDCPDVHALAAFYAAVIGGTPVAEDGEEVRWVVLEGHEGTRLAFQEAPGFVPPSWPSADGSQQFHLDFSVTDIDAAEEQVLALGAKLLDAPDATDPSCNWRVYADPAGHPFCLCFD